MCRGSDQGLERDGEVILSFFLGRLFLGGPLLRLDQFSDLGDVRKSLLIVWISICSLMGLGSNRSNTISPIFLIFAAVEGGLRGSIIITSHEDVSVLFQVNPRIDRY